jgi:hypothetical protein
MTPVCADSVAQSKASTTLEQGCTGAAIAVDGTGPVIALGLSGVIYDYEL